MSEKNNTPNIGDLLRKAREDNNLSISAAAMQTNLKSIVIQKLEKNQFREIGAPVFTRGYLVSYARFLGLDTHQIAEGFNQLRQEETELHITNANVASQIKPLRKRRFGPILVAIPFLIIAGFIVAQAINPNSWMMTTVKTFLGKTLMTSSESPKNDEVDNQANDITLLVGNDSASKATQDTASDTPVGTNAQPLTLESTSNINALANNTNANDSNDSSETVDLSVDSTPIENRDSQVALDNSPQIAPENSQAAAETTDILITTTADNWIEIRNAKNQVFTSKVYRNGQTITLPSSGAPYQLKAGVPSAIKLTINGNDHSLDSYRVKDSTRNFIITTD